MRLADFLLCPGLESNQHGSLHTPLKRARLPIPPPGLKLFKDYLFTFVFELAFTVAELFTAVVFTAVFVTFPLALEFASAFVAVFAGAVVELSDVVCKTETFPVIAGKANNNAESIKIAAAVIVILDKTDCVPRGPKAVLEILLVKSAPASVLPGCRRTVAIKTKHEIKNNP